MPYAIEEEDPNDPLIQMVSRNIKTRIGTAPFKSQNERDQNTHSVERGTHRKFKIPPLRFYDLNFDVIEGKKDTVFDLTKRLGRTYQIHPDDDLPYRSLLD